MKKIVIVTDGNQLRAFRIDLERSINGLVSQSSEIRQSPHEIHPGAPRWDRYGPCLEVRHKRYPTVHWPDDREVGDGMAHGASVALDEMDLRALAERISHIVLDEGAVIWNLVAPRDLLQPLQDALHPDAHERLTAIVIGDLVAISLEEVDSKFRNSPSTGLEGAAEPVHAKN